MLALKIQYPFLTMPRAKAYPKLNAFRLCTKVESKKRSLDLLKMTVSFRKTQKRERIFFLSLFFDSKRSRFFLICCHQKKRSTRRFISNKMQLTLLVFQGKKKFYFYEYKMEKHPLILNGEQNAFKVKVFAFVSSFLWC